MPGADLTLEARMNVFIGSEMIGLRLGALLAAALASGCGDAPSATAPPLASLGVTPLALSPAFSPDVHDYTINCGAGTSSLTIDLAAAPGATVSVSAPVQAPAAPSQSVALSVAEGQAIVV